MEKGTKSGNQEKDGDDFGWVAKIIERGHGYQPPATYRSDGYQKYGSKADAIKYAEKDVKTYLKDLEDLEEDSYKLIEIVVLRKNEAKSQGQVVYSALK